LLQNSGEREHIERLRFKIKSTGRQLTSDQQLVLQDAENNDTTMGYLYMIAEECQVGMVDEITAKMREIANDVLPVVDLHYRTMVDRVIDTVRDKYKSLNNDTVRRLNTSINFGAQELEAQTVQKILSSAAAIEICTKANDSFMSALEIATGYIFEKLAEGMQDIVDDVHKAPQSDEPTYQAPPTFTTSSSASSVHDDTTSIDDSDASFDEPPSRPPPKTRAPDPPTGAKPPAVAPRPDRPERPGRPSSNISASPSSSASPPSPGGPTLGGGRGRGLSPGAGAAPSVGRGRGNLVIPGGLDPSKMLIGGPPRKPVAAAAEPPSPEPTAAPVVAKEEPPKKAAASPAKPDDKKAAKSSSGGGLFGRKKPAAPDPKKSASPSKPAAARPPSVARPAASGGGDSVLDSVPTEVNTITEHLTKDRPMIQRKRKPPTRRPRGPAAAGDA
jgi:hypothetical protein